jgi:hypothetical protein
VSTDRKLVGAGGGKSRRGDLVYVGMIALAIAAAWVGVRSVGNEPDQPFDESRLNDIFVDVEIPMIDLKELPFGFFRPSKLHTPMPARVRYADEVEVALVENRNRLLFTAGTQPPRTQ